MIVIGRRLSKKQYRLPTRCAFGASVFLVPNSYLFRNRIAAKGAG